MLFLCTYPISKPDYKESSVILFSSGLKTPTEVKGGLGRKSSAVPSDRSDRSDEEEGGAAEAPSRPAPGLGAEGSELWEDSDAADLEYCNNMPWGKVSEGKGDIRARVVEGSELWEDSDAADLEYCNNMPCGKVRNRPGGS